VQKHGFSRPISKEWYDLLGVPPEEKREFFNTQARNVVAACAVTAGALGLVNGGLLGGTVMAALAAVFGVKFVRKDRMFR
jgi:hypothetical protein